MPTIGRDLTPQQELACALRIMAHDGWQENLSGHITAIAPNETMFVNPWGLWWSEVRASDIVRVDMNGNLVDGKWDVTPAVFLHTELHRVRNDARVIIHNHPFAATLLACMGQLPTISHQNSALLLNELVFVDEYDGTIETARAGLDLADRVGSASAVLLANHGAIAMGPSFGAACYLATTFERACRFTVEAKRCGTTLQPLPTSTAQGVQVELRRNTADAFWRGAVRQLIVKEPEVLT
jgi:ribulose-5-phosphate 4-epimerase/fuculose-1-phosphate aldolase